MQTVIAVGFENLDNTNQGPVRTTRSLVLLFHWPLCVLRLSKCVSRRKLVFEFCPQYHFNTFFTGFALTHIFSMKVGMSAVCLSLIRDGILDLYRVVRSGVCSGDCDMWFLLGSSQRASLSSQMHIIKSQPCQELRRPALLFTLSHRRHWQEPPYC